jgi:hypothetical protein
VHARAREGKALEGVQPLPPVPPNVGGDRGTTKPYDEYVTAMPLWTILIPTLGERRPLFERLMRCLLPQLDAHHGAVRVLALHNNGSPPLPEIRERLVAAADSEYVSFVDDDDLVPDYYVSEVVAALATRPDQVGFRVQCYSDRRPTAVAYHSLEYGGWRNGEGVHYRDISHINPMRTEIVRMASFRTRPGRPEDRTWVDQLRATGALKTEVVIDRVMYHYLYSTSRTGGIGSRWQKPKLIRPGAQAAVSHPYFSYLKG